MWGGLFLLILTTLAAITIVNVYIRPGHSDNRLLKQIYFYHVALAIVYYFYVLYNPSDSKGYFFSAQAAENWSSLYGVSTTFITFLAFPFVKYLGFTYEACMALFSFFGFIGFLFFFLSFREQIHFKHTFFGVDLFKLIFFLPNLHFWSGSLGKGSVIFLGISLFFYGICRVKNRMLFVILGSLIIYHVRPHIMLVILVSYALSFVFTTQGVTLFWRMIFLAGATIAFFFIYRDVLTLIGIDEEQFISQGLDLAHRATELSKATSGLDITNYGLPLQVFTFLYRPLFFDAPGALGLIVSIENVFYVLITFRFFSRISGWRYAFFGNFLSKGALLSFLSVTIALAQISGNLGLAIRQKSQVMILFMFVVLSYLDDQKIRQRSRILNLKRKRQAQAFVDPRNQGYSTSPDSGIPTTK